MGDVKLSKLSRAELLKLLIAQGERLEAVELELAEAKRQLNERTIVAAECGSLAEAAVRLSGVLNAAQDAADWYLKSVQAAHPLSAVSPEGSAASQTEEAQHE